ncbi:MAG TPA: hypothetical protein PKO44_00470 [Candidatus Omnitrophota bacterium]|nr:hypothetical protein [Candidatus Omnitrophota bacterium]
MNDQDTVGNNQAMTKPREVFGLWRLYFLACLCLISCFLVFFSPSFAFAQDAGYGRFIGETIRYDVRGLGVKQADATMTLQGRTTIDGREAYLILFQAQGSNFLDAEKIYADHEEFFPLRIERDLNIFGSIEKIVEVYDQDQHTVTITKTTKAKPQPQVLVLTKEDKIDNIYCFIYRYRLKGSFRLGSSLRMNLPTKDVSVRIAKKMPLSVAGKDFQTFFLETVPSQYRLWFDDSPDRLPLRIDKPAMIGGTSMIMTEYKKK